LTLPTAAVLSERWPCGSPEDPTVTRSRVEFRLPPDEKVALHATARDYGISVSAYLRILAIEDRERRKRAELRAKCYPDKRIGND
jgi:hypothetical protein